MKGEYQKRKGEPARMLLAQRLPRSLDRRVALTDDDKRQIRDMYRVERMGIREIARVYEGKCSRRLIQFVLFPERYEVARKQFIARRKDGRYKPTKEQWRNTMREHRHYKKKVLGKGI